MIIGKMFVYNIGYDLFEFEREGCPGTRNIFKFKEIAEKLNLKCTEVDKEYWIDYNTVDEKFNILKELYVTHGIKKLDQTVNYMRSFLVNDPQDIALDSFILGF